MNFIPADESVLVQRFFRIYVKWLFKRRFKNIWIHQEYKPDDTDRTVYFLNHTSWWDGLIPFLLNEYRFNQQGRAMMEHKQMRAYPFFKHLGAFSMMHGDRSHNLSSLRYAIQSMERTNASLYVYPEGEIKPANAEIKFERGTGWLRKQLPDVDFVPIGIHIHTIRHDKPELNLWIGSPVKPDESDDVSVITSHFETVMRDLMHDLKHTSGFDDSKYAPFF